MSLISWISLVISTVLRLLKSLWVGWGIQLLVAASLACEIVLAILGNRRKYVTSILPRIIIWASYLLLSYIATIALGKLTVVRIDDPDNPGYNEVLVGLLAPLLLMQLGYPDSITAYAVEDNRLGLRQVLNIGATVVIVVWILIRCWDGLSPISRLYFPLFVVGIMKSAGWVWALQSVYDENSSVTAEDIREEANIQRAFEEFPRDEKFKPAKDILKAYFRFDCLKPHLVNWLYHPLFISRDWMSIDSYTADQAFSVTEIELNFMYDVLYTKAPILYTNMGLIARFFGFFSIMSALCAFAAIFKNAFLIDMYITYTYALLMAVASLELYQISMLAFSDWAVVKMSVNLKVPLVQKLLPFLAKQCMKQRRWSRSVGQLNLLDPNLLYKEFPKPIATVLDWFEKREIVRRYWLHSHQAIPSSLKVLVVQNMAELEKKRHLLPFTERGKWTLETHGIQRKQGLSGSVETTFERSIIIWHIATEILHRLENECSDACRGSKLLSDYMIYLLALRPYMLSLTTADITLEYACCTLWPFLRYRDYNEAISTLSLSSPDGEVPPPIKLRKETRITRDWNVLSEVQKLVVDLRTLDNKWELISSIWVEILCFAAHNCHVYHHAKLLRRGGELITHVWLLLAHKTDKYHSSNDQLPKNLAASTKSSSLARGSSSCFQKIFGKVDAKHLYN
ncbi:uncharacterized protein LOC104436706 [Eucalyptus grandis]|uniref:uncharacterized protein LOC104436706 n=1 Tax=Eucalyptus grandis TaxID=71139 RepID=UPI00192EC80C|nr:uncharacterized protein LOC104436706 [Eucalyptus grandis]XP_010047855.2 uncharacterized protein LOC104436706 [Eucalyptus grandis]